MFRLDGLIAFACRPPQSFNVGDFDLPAAVADDAGLLKRVGDDRNRVALHADHLCEKLLGQRQCFAVVQFARAQQPA